MENYYSKEVIEQAVIEQATAFFDAIKKGRDEAVKRGIEANTIMISKSLAYRQEFPVVYNSLFGTDSYVMPPAIYGMEAYIASEKELPEGVGFEISHRNFTAVDRIRREAQEDLLKSMREMSLQEIAQMIYGEDEGDTDE